MVEPTAEVATSPTPVKTETPDRWGWLKNPLKAIFGGNNPTKQEGPIPGVTPAQPEELTDPRVKSPNDPNPLTGVA